jgi:hypothetical protein
MLRLSWCFAFVFPLAAHMVSMSSGELTVKENSAHFELRMPTYELVHVRDPQRTLLEHVRFRSGGAWAKVGNTGCRTEQDNYVCEADYQFPAGVEELTVECTLAAVTVPNHIHLLHAYRGDKTDQAVFDLSFTTANLRFRPPTALETAVREFAAGFSRAAAGLAPLLFLASLVLAARSRRELFGLTAAFLVGEGLACALVPRTGLSLSPRFIEAAAALTIAYLAFEIVALPNSGMRWLVVGVLGLFHGTYFSIFLMKSGYHLGTFFSAVVSAEVLLIAVFALILGGLARFAWTRRAVPILASLLLTTGLVWFFVRLRA